MLIRTNYFFNLVIKFFLGFEYEKKIKTIFIKLKKNKKIHIIEDLLLNIEKENLNLDKSNFKLSYSIPSEKINQFYSQFIFSKLMNKFFYLYLMKCIYENRKISFPMPDKWISLFEKRKLKINRLLSKYLFKLFTVYYFFNFIVKTFKILFSRSINSSAKKIYVSNPPNINPSNTSFNDNFFLWITKYLKLSF